MTRKTLRIFIRAQCSSLISTVVDFGVTIILTDGCGWWYLIGTSVGTTLGGGTNFFLGRKWVFNASEISPVSQAIRYILVWGGSIILNIGGVFLLTSIVHLNYLLSKAILAILVGIFFNYLLQKKFVFNQKRELVDISIS